jgi:hypothetical protein
MKRDNAFLSPIGFLLMFFFFLGLGYSVWRSGGLAFSPGPLTDKRRSGVQLQGFRSHAEFETACQACHQPLKARQDGLCQACHTDIAAQRAGKSGLHARIQGVADCAACHRDHRGRDFDPSSGDLASFDHAVTGFSLVWHQVTYAAAPMGCVACHGNGPSYARADPACLECHAGRATDFMRQHIQDFGAACSSCHDGLDKMVGFDHNQTGFQLSGKHAAARCADCHVQGRFQGTPTDCARCHTEPRLHQGLFSAHCEDCHTLDSWKPASLASKPFDHDRATTFSLARHAQDYAGQPMTCQECHSNGVALVGFLPFPQAACVDCHAANDATFMDQHQAQFGSDCLVCHDGADRLSDFDHANFFPLEGRHAEIDCTACHQDQGYRGTPKECVRCHAEPPIHAGSFGLQCQWCHSAAAWAPARLRAHPFPLDHGWQGETACQVCHPSTYVEYTCYGCHTHQPQPVLDSHLQQGISIEELPACTNCHPAGER